MPMIPLPGPALENTNVPDPALRNPNGAGQVERAQAEAAGQVANVAMDLLKKRKAAQDSDFAFKTYVDDYQAINEYSNQLKLESPEDASGYADKMKQFVEKRRSTNEAQAPSQDALRLYRDKSTSLFKGSEIEAQNFENTTRAKYYVKSMNESANALAATFLSNPDWTKAKAAQLEIENQIEENAQTHFVDAGTRETLKQAARDHVSMSVYDGLAAQENYSRQIQLLKNTDEATDIFKGMNAEKRGSLLRAAENGLDVKRRQNDAELRNRISDVMASQMNGQPIDPRELQVVSSQLQASGLKPWEKQKYGDALQISSVVANHKNELLNKPFSEWRSPEELIPARADGQNARVVNQAQAVLGREMMSLRKEAEKDGAAYAIRSSPVLQQMGQTIRPGDTAATQEYATQLLGRQQALGITRPRILTEAQAENVGKNFETQSADEAARAALALKASYGKFAPKVFNEIADAGKLPPDFTLISFIPNPQAAAAVVDNLKNSSKIKDAFEQRFKTSDGQLSRNVTAKLEPYMAAMNANQTTGALALSNSLQNQVKIEAMKQRVMSGLGEADAIERAINTVVTPNFAPVRAANSNFLMPRYDGSGRVLDEKVVSAYVKSHTTPESFEKLGVKVPSKFVALDSPDTWSNKVVSANAPMGGDPSLKSEQEALSKRSFYAQLAKSGYWTPSADSSELILAVKINGQPVAVKDASGNQIRQSLHNIMYDQDSLTVTEQSWAKFIPSNPFKTNSANAEAK